VIIEKIIYDTKEELTNDETSQEHWTVNNTNEKQV